MSISHLSQLILVGVGVTIMCGEIFGMQILSPGQSVWLGIAMFLGAVLINLIQKRKKIDRISSKIDHNLKLLSDLFEKFHGLRNEALHLSEALRSAQQVVVSTSENPIKTESVRSLERDISHFEFDRPTSLHRLPKIKKRQVREFYEKLGKIAILHDRIIKLGDEIVSKTNLNKQLEDLIKEVLEKGNPLKPHN